MKVAVTGGTGFLGKSLQRMVPKWTYLSSSDVNLSSLPELCDFLAEGKFDTVIHLAARVGGIKDNIDHPAEFFYENTIMNSNVVHACYKTGIKRLLSTLSTCAFPNRAAFYPFAEEELLAGPPAKTNRSYGFTKRALYIQTLAYREQYGLNYSCISPSNLYGPGDNFDSENSHFVPAMVKKFHEAKNGDTLTFWGNGRPLRQQLFVDDLCVAIPHLLVKHCSDVPLLVVPNENLSIKEMVSACRTIANKDLDIRFEGDSALSGQYRKDGSNRKFKELLPFFKFTSFIDGLRQTYDWYAAESNNNGN
tara:strand:- start:761 stop:1678 length:918 start_codon:yes stop_codon:yes gene_type:complete